MKDSQIHLPDSQIWYRLKEGDENALTILMRRYFDDLYRYGYRFCPDEGVVEECIQDLFVDLWVKRKNLSEVSYVKSYLLKSLRRRLLRKVLAIRKQGLADLSDDYSFMLDFSPEEALIQQQLSDEHTQRLTDSLNQLPPRQKEAIYLRFFENLNYNDIAQVMSVTVAYLYELIYKGIQNLRQRLMVLVTFILIILLWN